jgi:hypothetical protein
LATETIQSHLIFQIFISLSGEILLLGKACLLCPWNLFFYKISNLQNPTQFFKIKLSLKNAVIFLDFQKIM